MAHGQLFKAWSYPCGSTSLCIKQTWWPCPILSEIYYELLIISSLLHTLISCAILIPFLCFSRSQVMASFTYRLHFPSSGKSLVRIISLIAHLLSSQDLSFSDYSCGKSSQFSLTWIPENLAPWRTHYSHTWPFFISENKSLSICHLLFSYGNWCLIYSGPFIVPIMLWLWMWELLKRQQQQHQISGHCYSRITLGASLLQSLRISLLISMSCLSSHWLQTFYWKTGAQELVPCGFFSVIFPEVHVYLLLVLFLYLFFLLYQYMLFLLAVQIWFLEKSSSSISTNNLDTFKYTTQLIFWHLVPQ